MLDREIIKALLEIKAVELRVDKENWFTWASGIKSPIYCDNRLTMSYPKIRKQIAEGFVKKIKELYPNVDYIVGTATAGIPHAAWISDIMELPMLYVRGSAKDHGKTNQIEGKFEKGKKVVVVEDLISTGKSSVLAAQALQEAGLEVLGVIAIFSYNLNKAKEKLIELVEKEYLRNDIPQFKAGDTIGVYYKVKEGNKERVQLFEGVVIRVNGGGVAKTFTVRKVTAGIGVERIIPVNSPNIDRIEVLKVGRVRRSKLYYLRGLSAKKARIKEIVK